MPEVNPPFLIPDGVERSFRDRAERRGDVRTAERSERLLMTLVLRVEIRIPGIGGNAQRDGDKIGDEIGLVQLVDLSVGGRVRAGPHVTVERVITHRCGWRGAVLDIVPGPDVRHEIFARHESSDLLVQWDPPHGGRRHAELGQIRPLCHAGEPSGMRV